MITSEMYSLEFFYFHTKAIIMPDVREKIICVLVSGVLRVKS